MCPEANGCCCSSVARCRSFWVCWPSATLKRAGRFCCLPSGLGSPSFSRELRRRRWRSAIRSCLSGLAHLLGCAEHHRGHGGDGLAVRFDRDVGDCHRRVACHQWDRTDRLGIAGAQRDQIGRARSSGRRRARPVNQRAHDSAGDSEDARRCWSADRRPSTASTMPPTVPARGVRRIRVSCGSAAGKTPEEPGSER